MAEHRMDEIEAGLGALVQVSTLEEGDDDVGWVNLRIICSGSTLSVLMEPERARELAAALRKHAERA